MCADLLLTVLVFRRCREVDWDKTASKEGSDRYGFTSAEVLEIEKQKVQVGKRPRFSCGGSISVTLTVAPLLFQAGRGRAHISVIRRMYDVRHGLAFGLEPVGSVDLDAWFDQDIL